jgi:hypothetical protein
MTKAPEINSPADMRALSDAELAAWMWQEATWAVAYLQHGTGSQHNRRDAAAYLVAALIEAARRINQEDGA